MPEPRIINLSFAKLKPVIVTLPSAPTTSSPSQLASYTNVSASEVAATVSLSIST